MQSSFINDEISKADKMVRLLEDEIFNELFIEGFIKDGIYQNVIENNLDNNKTNDELKARQILHRYIFDIITSGDKLR